MSRRAASRWATRARSSPSSRSSEQRVFARDAVARGLSVRETEQMVTRAISAPGAPDAKKAASRREPDVHTRAAQDKLRLTFGTRVDIVRKGKGGEIGIAFKNEEELSAFMSSWWGNSSKKPEVQKSEEMPVELRCGVTVFAPLKCIHWLLSTDYCATDEEHRWRSD